MADPGAVPSPAFLSVPPPSYGDSEAQVASSRSRSSSRARSTSRSRSSSPTLATSSRQASPSRLPPVVWSGPYSRRPHAPRPASLRPNHASCVSLHASASHASIASSSSFASVKIEPPDDEDEKETVSISDSNAAQPAHPVAVPATDPLAVKPISPTKLEERKYTQLKMSVSRFFLACSDY